MKNRVAVLVSGGLDSAALIAQATQTHSRVYPIYVRQGLRWEAVELYWLRRYLKRVHADPLTLLALSMVDVYSTHWSVGGASVPGAHSRDSAVYLPGRNMLLSLKAAVFCNRKKISKLAIGSLDHNPFPDATPAFFKQWSRVVSIGLDQPIRIIAPFRGMTKSQVIRRFSAYPLELSFSCLAPVGRRHCGRCNKCAERQCAFRQAGKDDKTIYAQK